MSFVGRIFAAAACLALTQYAAAFPEAVQALRGHLERGDLKSRETVLGGFERLPEALMGLFHGDNTGKQLVRVDD